MAESVPVSLSGLDRVTGALNDSDLVLVSQINTANKESAALALSQLRSHLDFDIAYTTTTAGMAGTELNEIFFVYTDTAKTTLNKYTNRGTSAEQEIGSDNLAVRYFSREATEVLSDFKDGLTKSDGVKAIRAARVKPTNDVSALSNRLNVLKLNIWEFADKVTDKPDADDPNTWDWSPATQAAFNALGEFVSFKYGSATRYSSAELVYPPGYYRHAKQCTMDYSIYSGYSSGRPRVTIFSEGAIIGCAVSKNYVWTFKGTYLTMNNLTFMKDPSITYGYGFKLGDETKTDASYSVSGIFTNIRMMSLTKGVTLGWGFDQVWINFYITGFDQDPTETAPATGFEILAHVNDNCNHLTFIRPQFETTNTTNYEAFRINGNAHLSTHHNIHVYGGHFESHYWGIKLLAFYSKTGEQPALLQSSFNGVVFLENGSAPTTVAAASTNLILIQGGSSIALNSCRVATNNVTTAAFDSSTHKSLIKYSGSVMGLSIRDTYFITAFGSVSGSTSNLSTCIDVTEHVAGNNSYTMESCTINDFRRSIGTHGRVMSGRIQGNRKMISTMSDDGVTWGMYYTNVDFMTSPFTRVFEANASGYLYANNYKGTYCDTQLVRVGYDLTTAGDRFQYFYPSGTTTPTVTMRATTGGQLRIDATSDIVLAAAVGASSIRMFGNVVGYATNTYSLGTASITWSNIYSQNAVTVVSDKKKKTDFGDIPDALLAIWFDYVHFQEYRLIDEVQKDPDSAKLKVGIIAQDVIAAFNAAGINWQDYDVVKYNSWPAVPGVDAVPATYDEETGELITEAIPAVPEVPGGDSYMVSYDMIHVIEAAAVRRVLFSNSGS